MTRSYCYQLHYSAVPANGNLTAPVVSVPVEDFKLAFETVPVTEEHIVKIPRYDHPVGLFFEQVYTRLDIYNVDDLNRPVQNGLFIQAEGRNKSFVFAGDYTSNDDQPVLTTLINADVWGNYQGREGRAAPRPIVAMTNATGIRDAVPGILDFKWKGILSYIGRPYSNPLTVIDFGEDPTSYENELLKQIASAPNFCRLPNGMTLNNVNYCGMDPAGTVWIGKNDFSDAAGKIPQNIANNTAERFMNFPSVFVRRAKYLSGVSALSNDSATIDFSVQEDQPFRIVQNNVEAYRSTWLLSIDGSIHHVIINHEGEGLFTAVDVWKQKLEPLISGSSTAYNPNSFSIPTFADRIKISKFQFLEYARCLSMDVRNPDDQVSQLQIEAKEPAPVFPQ